MKRHWETDELVEHWTLLPRETELLTNKTGATRLGFAVLLKFFQLEAYFPQQATDVPTVAVEFIAKQVKVTPEQFEQYQWRGRTIEYHRAQIRRMCCNFVVEPKVGVGDRHFSSSPRTDRE